MISLFKKYYQTKRIQLDHIEKREIAINPFTSPTMERRLSFTNNEEFNVFLAKRCPKNVFRSAGYFKQPYQAKLEDKRLLRCDLIFDIDADHFAHTTKFKLMEMDLDRAKEETFTLINRVLIDRFGIDTKDISIQFSGYRGYHVIVTNRRYQLLTGSSRNMIAEFVSGYSHIDKPVTKDVHRLIRLEGSLHGKTGLKTTKIRYIDLDRFDPSISSTVFRGFTRAYDQ